MMRAIVAALILAALALPARAQTTQSGTWTDLANWLATQQYQAGTAFPIEGQAVLKNTYAATAWDAISYGQAGINVGLASAQDYVDLGPCMDMATGRVTRYGIAPGFHVGNMWNAASGAIPSNVSNHFYLAVLPNLSIEAQFLFPQSGAINQWTWKNDFKLAAFYRFGPSSTAAATAARARKG